jgi:hypothetical protein
MIQKIQKTAPAVAQQKMAEGQPAAGATATHPNWAKLTETKFQELPVVRRQNTSNSTAREQAKADTAQKKKQPDSADNS